MYDNDFYKKLKKPKCTPPPVVFQSAWGILYLLMFISFAIVLHKGTSFYKTLGIFFFGLQLILNLLWAPVFFILENIKLAFVIAVLLTISVFATVFCFIKLSLISAILLIPYIIWLFFACYLNLCFLSLNSDKY